MIEQRCVALLRGINVGGKNTLPMQALEATFRGVGAEQVETYIQSGNVIFNVAASSMPEMAREITARIWAEFHLRVPVTLRDLSELRAVVEGNPFAGEDEATLHCMFLADTPGMELVSGLDSTRSPGDEFQVIGREVYLRMPNGVARTKLTNAWFDSRLRTIGTQRNWRTVNILAERMSRSGVGQR